VADLLAAFTADVREAPAEREVELRRASLRAVPPSAA
jgi:hypothetical protein